MSDRHDTQAAGWEEMQLSETAEDRAAFSRAAQVTIRTPESMLAEIAGLRSEVARLRKLSAQQDG